MCFGTCAPTYSRLDCRLHTRPFAANPSCCGLLGLWENDTRSQLDDMIRCSCAQQLGGGVMSLIDGRCTHEWDSTHRCALSGIGVRSEIYVRGSHQTLTKFQRFTAS